jgi:hypothetical protein
MGGISDITGSQNPKDLQGTSNVSDTQSANIRSRNDKPIGGSTVDNFSSNSSDSGAIINKPDKDLDKDENVLKHAFLKIEKIDMPFLTKFIADEPIIMQGIVTMAKVPEDHIVTTKIDNPTQNHTNI